ncbi:sensor histidine kinase [Amycolatopsis minnesotensis]|uniref:Sensor histidine kinase n=2 Tax=Amycolatopsis minnesotensis TaxID=337894 RepID=A0ABP5EF48_9PSEU
MTEATRRWFWLWDVFFVIVYAATAAVVATETTEDTVPGARYWSLALVAVTALAYVTVGRRVEHEGIGGTRRAMFVVVLVVASVAAIMLRPSAGFALFATGSMLFMVAPVRLAVTITVLMTTVPPLSIIVHFGVAMDPNLGVLIPFTGLMVLFAAFVGPWIERVVSQSKERAQLIDQLEASQAEVSRLSREAGTAAERERLAREIHDTLAQGFTSIVTLAQAIESEMDRDPDAAKRHLALAARTARDNLAEARAMVAELTPAALGSSTVEAAMRREAARLDESGMDVTCEIGELPKLPTATEVVLLRGVQEALTNVRKHAGASAVAIRLRVANGSIRLTVRDDGAGFEVSSGHTGYGLDGMRARATEAGGSLTIHSGPEDGTTVELEVPV